MKYCLEATHLFCNECTINFADQLLSQLASTNHSAIQHLVQPQLSRPPISTWQLLRLRIGDLRSALPVSNPQLFTYDLYCRHWRNSDLSRRPKSNSSDSIFQAQFQFTSGMCNVMTQIVDYCIANYAGPAPCPFVFAALGSTARGELSPFSDLEFCLILGSDILNESSLDLYDDAETMDDLEFEVVSMSGEHDEEFSSTYFGRLMLSIDAYLTCIGEPNGFRLGAFFYFSSRKD